MTLKNNFLSIFFIICSLTTYAQKKEKIKGSRNVTTNETPINSFNKIHLTGDFYIDIIEGETASVFIETDDNLHDVINFTVADSVLSFQTTKRITSRKKLNIKVIYTSTLKEIETIDNSEISSLTSLNIDHLNLRSSDASRMFLNVKSKSINLVGGQRSKIKLNLTSNQAKFELSDNSKLDALIESDSILVDMYQRSDAKLKGTLSSLKIRNSNSSTLVAKDLVTENCNVLAEDNSNVTVNTSSQLILDVSGSSDVYIYNNPKITINKFENTSKLHKKELKSQ